MGMPYESRNTYKGGLVRMDITMSGEPMSMVLAAEPCWMQTGPVVQPCTAEERRLSGAMGAMVTGLGDGTVPDEFEADDVVGVDV